MHAPSFGGLLVVAVIALGAPLIVGLFPAIRLPAVVLEIVAGIAVGPSGFGWVEVDVLIQVLSLIGLAFLLFLAGLEIDVARLRGPVLRKAGTGYLATMALGLAMGLAFGAAGWVKSPLLMRHHPVRDGAGHGYRRPRGGGPGRGPGRPADDRRRHHRRLHRGRPPVPPVLRDVRKHGEPAPPPGAVRRPGRPHRAGPHRLQRSARLEMVLVKLQDTTAEIRVRLAVLLLIAFVAMAGTLGLEAVLGAFLAGAILGMVDRDTMTHPHFHLKLEAIGYGFVIPVFFVSSGLRFDLQALVDAPSAIARVPLFLAALLVVRALPALLYVPTVGRRRATAAGLLQATSLPFLVTATSIGVTLGEITPVTAAALVSAGLLSVIVFPLVAVSLLRSTEDEPLPVVAPAR